MQASGNNWKHSEATATKCVQTPTNKHKQIRAKNNNKKKKKKQKKMKKTNKKKTKNNEADRQDEERETNTNKYVQLQANACKLLHDCARWELDACTSISAGQPKDPTRRQHE